MREVMPVKKIPPHRTILRNLLSSKKLTDGERKALEKFQISVSAGNELKPAHKLWIETLKAKYLAVSHA